VFCAAANDEAANMSEMITMVLYCIAFLPKLNSW
jgi:hypothetical protein